MMLYVITLISSALFPSCVGNKSASSHRLTRSRIDSPPCDEHTGRSPTQKIVLVDPVCRSSPPSVPLFLFSVKLQLLKVVEQRRFLPNVLRHQCERHALGESPNSSTSCAPPPKDQRPFQIERPKFLLGICRLEYAMLHEKCEVCIAD